MFLLDLSCQSILPLTGNLSPPHLPRMPSNSALVSRPAVGAAQTLTWPHPCMFLPPKCTAARAKMFSLAGTLSLFVYSRHGVCRVGGVDLVRSLASWWEALPSPSVATPPLGPAALSPAPPPACLHGSLLLRLPGAPGSAQRGLSAEAAQLPGSRRVGQRQGHRGAGSRGAQETRPLGDFCQPLQRCPSEKPAWRWSRAAPSVQGRQGPGCRGWAGLLPGLASGPALLYRSAQQALRWYPRPGPFPIAQTSGTGCQPLCGPLLASRRRRPRGQRKTAVKARPGRGSAASPGLHAARPSSEGIPLPQVCSGHLPTVHSRSCPGIALQTQAPAPAAAAHCRGRASLPRYVVLWAGRSEDCRGWAAALSRSLRLPAVPNSRPDGGSDPCFGPAAPPAVTGAGLVLLSLLFLPPGFCEDLCIPLRCRGPPASFQLVPCEILRFREGSCPPVHPPRPILSSWFRFLLQAEGPRWDGGMEEVFKVFNRGILRLRQPDLGCHHTQASLIAQLVKNLPVVQKTRVRSLGREDPLEKEMATHCTIPAWKIP